MKNTAINQRLERLKKATSILKSEYALRPDEYRRLDNALYRSHARIMDELGMSARTTSEYLKVARLRLKL